MSGWEKGPAVVDKPSEEYEFLQNLGDTCVMGVGGGRKISCPSCGTSILREFIGVWPSGDRRYRDWCECSPRRVVLPEYEAYLASKGEPAQPQEGRDYTVEHQARDAQELAGPPLVEEAAPVPAALAAVPAPLLIECAHHGLIAPRDGGCPICATLAAGPDMVRGGGSSA